MVAPRPALKIRDVSEPRILDFEFRDDGFTGLAIHPKIDSDSNLRLRYGTKATCPRVARHFFEFDREMRL